MENTPNRKKIIAAVLVVCLFVAIFATIRLAAIRQGLKKSLPEQAVQEGIGKLGLVGQANLLLSAANSDIATGGTFEVESKVELTDSSLKISGADIVILYDKNKLEVVNVIPNVKTVYPDAPFDLVPIVTYGGSFDNTFNFLRVAESTSRSTTLLAGGTVSLAKITFRTKETGGGVIKYPDDNQYLEIVGSGTYVSPTPTSPVTPTVTPVPAATLTPTATPVVAPTLTPTTPTNTPVPVGCPRGDLGNLNCSTDGIINDSDLTIMLSSWAPNGPVPNPATGQHSADIVVDNKVDESDIAKLLDNWGNPK